jgi:hypothetical protein
MHRRPLQPPGEFPSRADTPTSWLNSAISIDLKTGRNLRFFIPSDLYMPDLTVTHMTGPMTSWTRANKPANRYQRLVRTSEPDYEVLKKQTCMRELSDLPKKHQKECKALAEIEKQAVTALESAIKSKPHEGNGSSTVLPVGG